MNAKWRHALETIGTTGATPERMAQAGITDQLTQQLLVAGLLRIDRANSARAYGATRPEAADTVAFYKLTAAGEDAIGIEPTHGRPPK
jgi:hypothetical protein